MIEWVSQADDEVGVFVEPKLRELLINYFVATTACRPALHKP